MLPPDASGTSAKEGGGSGAAGKGRRTPPAPSLPSPHVHHPPSAARNTVCRAPAATSATRTPASDATRVGVSVNSRWAAPASRPPAATLGGTPTPSWPCELRPVAYTRPERDRNMVCASPHATACTSSGSAVTRAGVSAACGTAEVGSPSWPTLFNPHAYANPVADTASVVLSPAAT